MNSAYDPITCLAECVAHAQYVGFADIEYQSRDWSKPTAPGEEHYVTKTRRPTTHDFEVSAMFTQTWGSTALGFGGIGGSAMTTAYVVVLQSRLTGEYLVYFGSRFAYKLVRPNSKFFEDIAASDMAGVGSHGAYRHEVYSDEV
jgi:hypothetical protein